MDERRKTILYCYAVTVLAVVLILIFGLVFVARLKIAEFWGYFFISLGMVLPLIALACGCYLGKLKTIFILPYPFLTAGCSAFISWIVAYEYIGHSLIVSWSVFVLTIIPPLIGALVGFIVYILKKHKEAKY